MEEFSSETVEPRDIEMPFEALTEKNNQQRILYPEKNHSSKMKVK